MTKQLLRPGWSCTRERAETCYADHAVCMYVTYCLTGPIVNTVYIYNSKRFEVCVCIFITECFRGHNGTKKRRKKNLHVTSECVICHIKMTSVLDNGAYWLWVTHSLSLQVLQSSLKVSWYDVIIWSNYKAALYFLLHKFVSVVT